MRREPVKKRKRRKRLDNQRRSNIILWLTCVTMLTAIAGMLYLGVSQKIISSKYNDIVKTDLAKKECMSRISEGLYHHQALIFQYIISGDRSEDGYNLKEESEDVRDGVLSIEETSAVSDTIYINIDFTEEILSGGKQSETGVILYVPEKKVLKKIEVTMGFGDVQMNGIQAESGRLQNADGDI